MANSLKLLECFFHISYTEIEDNKEMKKEVIVKFIYSNIDYWYRSNNHRSIHVSSYHSIMYQLVNSICNFTLQQAYHFKINIFYQASWRKEYFSLILSIKFFLVRLWNWNKGDSADDCWGFLSFYFLRFSGIQERNGRSSIVLSLFLVHWRIIWMSSTVHLAHYIYRAHN